MKKGGIGILEYTSQVKRFVGENGEKKIKSMIICKNPVASFVETALNAISLGQFSSLRKQLGFDEMFHLYLLCEMDTEEIFVIEKNQTINVGNISGKKDYYLNPKAHRVVPLEFHSIKTMDEFREKHVRGNTRDLSKYKESIKYYSPDMLISMLDNTKKYMGDQMYFDYDGKDNNCQIFIMKFLQANNVSDDQLEKFIYQDTEYIFQQLPDYVSKMAKGVTDVAGIFDFITKK